MNEIVKPGSKFPIMQNAHKALFVSGLVVLGSLILLTTKGLNLGIDFKGGNKLIVAFAEDTDVSPDDLKKVVGDLIEAKGQPAGQIEVQSFDVGDTDLEGNKVKKFQIYTELTTLMDDAKASEITTQISAAFPNSAVERPAETDKFIIVLEADAPVVPTKDKLRSILASVQGIDVTHAEIVSEEERAIDMDFYKEYNLSVQERTKEGVEIPEDDFDTQIRAHNKKKRQLLEKRTDRTYTIGLQQIQAEVEAALIAKYGLDKVNVESGTAVSPSVGSDLFSKGMLAMIYAIIGILIYIGLRFDFRYSPGAVAALVHDTVITLGIFSLFGIKFTLPIISALLTIIGYSLNDTIVVYDRIRENLVKFKGMDLDKLVNQSVNETLSRTFLTSITTLFVVVALLLLGGGLISDFALALTIGVIVGTYSSVFIASPLVIKIDEFLAKRRLQAQGRGQAAPSA